jgi:acyl-CoA synthetase (AMP-forming)/AMP-acid ligase II
MAIIDFFDRGWRINPKGTAYIAGEQSFSFPVIGEMSCRIAHALRKEGFGKGAKGAVLAGNDTIAWSCVLGLWRANVAWVPVNPRASAQENGAQVDAFDCEILFFQQMFAPMVQALQPRLPKVRKWVCIDAALPGHVALSDWIAAQPATPPAVRYDMEDLMAVVPTGGTTGAPKGVMLTHRNAQTFCSNFMIGCSYDANSPPVNLAAAPMTHTAGLLSLPCTARGGTVVILTKPEPAALLGAVGKHRVTELFLPPTVIYGLLGIPGIEKQDYSSLKYFLYGAAPMSVEKLKRAVEVFGPVMTGGYGQTEAPASITIMRPEEHFVAGRIADDERLSSCGRPSPLNRVVVLDDQNQPLPAGKVGEICVQGDLVMAGYYKAPDKTAETIVDGWLHTGDIGYLDAEAYLHITDRKKDMIITGGFNVYPSEVEQVIWSHPAVLDCAVIGVPDEKWGEAVKAVVEFKPGAAATADELIALVKEKLGSVKAPKSVDVVASLPRSPVGKVLKKDLRATYWQGKERRI